MRQNELQDIPPHRRELYFRIIDNDPDFHPITLRLHFLNDHFPPNKIDLALKWLIKWNFTGRAFKDWFKLQCSGSDLEMHAKLLQIVDNAVLTRPVVGKSFKL